MRVLEYVIMEKDAGRTVKSIARQEMRLSSSLFSNLKFQGGLTVGGRQVRADEKLQKGDVLRVTFLDVAEPIKGYSIPLEIAYQDEDYLIIHKPAPLPTLSSVHQSGPTLENALYAHLGEPENYIFRPVNRLDKGTSGLMAAALNAHAQQLLQNQLHTDAFVREYMAVCEGEMVQPEGVIDLPILEPQAGIKRQVHPQGRPARTHFWVMKRENGKTLLRLRLDTGRTHQIRVHLAALGYPIVGDFLYGTEHPALPGRFALHSCRICFIHPIQNVKIDLESSLPGELEALFH
ncbi:MAG: RluA family pseudouridine synthase [Clostridiales bacterium]|nr:RluA family pseudouridine synthase [Clostridiales bacterium]